MASKEQQLLGRAKNAVLTFLEKKLFIPKIYLDAEWDGESVDLLAIDRDGSGDVHAVSIFLAKSKPGRESFLDQLIADIETQMDRFEDISVQYKYIAVASEVQEEDGIVAGFPTALLDRSFSPDGVGRIGFIAVDFIGSSDPQTRLLLKPERFRAKVSQLVDEFVEQHAADWELRA